MTTHDEDKPQRCFKETDYEALAKDICDRYPEEAARHNSDKDVLLSFIDIVLKEGRGTINPKFMIEAIKAELIRR
jgi:hypothetical protein